MDIDPLADVGPPRYAVESDEEEDEYNPLRVTPTEPNQRTDVKLLGELQQERNLILATGDVAKYWARDTDLGEQIGAVTVNDIQVGLLFSPGWTDATVIVSEVLTRLPIWSMHQYALTILDSLKPPRIGLLDTYSAPSYIAENSTPLPVQDSPLRYLTLDESAINPTLKRKAELFSPPNLIQSTSASFLSIFSTNNPPLSGTLVLVPSPYIPRPPPKVLEPSNFLQLSEDHFEWSEATIGDAQQLLFLSVGESDLPQWAQDKSQGKRANTSALRKHDIGDGGIYI